MLSNIQIASMQIDLVWSLRLAEQTGVPFTRIFWHHTPDGQIILTLWEIK